MQRIVAFFAGLGCLLGPCAMAKLPPERLAELPPAVSREVDFVKDVKPILEASCVKCHGRGKSKGGFQLDTRETSLRESDSGASILPGNSRDSYLVHLVSALDPAEVMPDKGSRLTAEQVGILRAWIDQGVKWESGVSFAREAHRNLKPGRVDIPAVSGGASSHPVDRWMGVYWERHGIAPGERVDDRTFARRVYLDVVGLLPTPEENAAFLADPGSDKRERLVKALLADRTRYAQHWLAFWNDLLRNDYRGTGYIDSGREQITTWLYTALRENKPFDQFVRELLDPGEKGPRGFTKGIVWRGVINASQTPPMQAAQNISQVFLGVNLKCASCHDSFIDDWQLTDAYGMASIYADESLELVQCDKPLGKKAPVKFVFPEIGDLVGTASKAERARRLADLMVSRDNGRLPRTIVNRLWERFLGRGLVEPLDVMQNPAWHPELLDWLAEDLVEHGYDLQRTMTLILTSRAYQMPTARSLEAQPKDYVFQGPWLRRLSAEQFRDALGQLTGVWYDKPEGDLDRLLVERGEAKPLERDALWIWSDPHAASGVAPGRVQFRKQFELEVMPEDAVAVVNVDNNHRLWVNGKSARKQNDIPWTETTVVDLKPFLKAGRNLIAVEAVNGGEGSNPAGLLFYARLRGAKGNPVMDVGSDASWLVSTNAPDDWHKVEFDDAGWGRAQTLGGPDLAPWNLGTQFTATVAGKAPVGNVRASLVAADPLAVALGRPNREQVTSVRQQQPTMLQMLELTNGSTLAGLLKRGAEKWMADARDGHAVTMGVFQRGLGRAPTEREAAWSVAMLGERPSVEGVEDLLWSVAMLPEFQFVH
ncbi:MAG: DUF1549 domain-containing protein [Verrucomicrobiales bacterium]|nr:DUF1549 domain-containing protein [Verrucomicrobiales bacterium]